MPRVFLMEVYALHQSRWPREPGPFGDGQTAGFERWLEEYHRELPVVTPADLASRLRAMGPVLDSFAGRTGLERL